MTDESPESPEQPEIGLAELSVLSVIQKEWKTVSIEQRGPDGTEVLGLLIFYVCPICFAVVPAPLRGDETIEFHVEHSGWHRKQARDFDVLNRLIAILQEMATPSDEEPGEGRRCPIHLAEIVWEPGGADMPTINGRYYCPVCQRQMAEVLDRKEPSDG